MGDKYLIDTSAVIKYLSNVLPKKGATFVDQIVDGQCTISFISEIELQVWESPKKEDILVFLDFIKASDIIIVNHDIIQKTIEIRKKFRLKLPDAVIAATAMVYGLTLISDNDKDFVKVAGMKYVNPMKIN